MFVHLTQPESKNKKLMKKKVQNYLLLIAISACSIASSAGKDLNGNKTDLPGKKSWEPVLQYTLDLHKKSTHPATYPFDRPWEEIGPGYWFAPAFGHWDIVHQIFDAFVYDKQHGLDQLYNDIKNQEPHGLLPGSIWFPRKDGKVKAVRWNKTTEGHPPMWVYAVDEYMRLTGNREILPDFFTALVRQITWFENERKAKGKGFFYHDIIDRHWESGVDAGVRFDEADLGPQACIDATSHVCALYHFAGEWAKELGLKSTYFKEREKSLKDFINNELFNNKKQCYFDSWSVNDSSKQHYVFENFWPMVVGIASKERADYLIDNFILNPKHFLAVQGVTTVSMSDPKFELRMWRGPVWNSMTFWIVKGCIHYGRYDAAKILLERALDSTAKQFAQTGEIWEFYHPHGGDPKKVKRKGNIGRDYPSPAYLGHNPLLAMAKLYDEVKKKAK
ncbi:hypothetical protein EYV94_23395 [Puteibacter caeruleilacunae]|nr:hypothetical protein EYV94_23395 [Puteibacter caeruleilacunae]